MSEEYPHLQRTNLSWDPYMEFLIATIDEANYMKRAQAKPMMTPRHEIESHLTSRAIHLRETADIAKRIAAKLGLNDNLAYIGMLLHDAGHPFSAHEGEEIFNYLDEIYNGQYFHHNAKGLEVIDQEGILEDALRRIPGLNPELEAVLRDEFYYFLDIVISHDGEAKKSDLRKKKTEYPSIREAVEDKATQANSNDNYKFVAQTPEGQVAKHADAIAYLATDIQDAFRMGLLTEFDDQYLEIIGAMILKNKEYTTNSEPKEYSIQEKITAARQEIDLLLDAKLRERFPDKKTKENDVNTEENEELISVARVITKRIEVLQGPRKRDREKRIEEIIKRREEKGRVLSKQQKKQIRHTVIKNYPIITEEEIENIIEEEISKYRVNKPNSTPEDMLKLESQEERIIEFAGKKLNLQSEVIQGLTQHIQEFLINDIIVHCKTSNNDTPEFSEDGLDLLNQLKTKNMNEFVVDSKWDYQQKDYPQVALKMINDFSQSVLKSGVIRTKFYDESIRKKISPEALEYMKAEFSEKKLDESKAYKREIGLRNMMPTVRTTERKKLDKARIACKIIRYIERKGESFARQYMYTFNAIPTRIRRKIEMAFNFNPEKQNELYAPIIDEQYDEIRKKFSSKHGDKAYSDITEEEKEKFTQELIDEARQDMEGIMAKQMVSDYFAGMTDESFKHTIQTLGLCKKETFDNAIRGRNPSKGVVITATALENDGASHDER